MKAAADSAGIHLLTNYETTWYPSVHRTQAMVADGAIGPLRKIVVRDGHEGPKEIGVGDEFLEWLTDPVQNGGGALIDFGCYGANLITWLMDGQRPTSVFAVTQTIKPEIYEDVDDEATIVLTYPEAQGIIQASWNWPFSRKDMSVYGRTGYIHADNNVNLRIRLNDGDPERQVEAEQMADQFDDPFSYLAAVVQGRTRPANDLSSLETNMIVVEILDAARRSAESGQTIYLDGRE
jgi:predicted dehydrogenase